MLGYPTIVEWSIDTLCTINHLSYSDTYDKKLPMVWIIFLTLLYYPFHQRSSQWQTKRTTSSCWWKKCIRSSWGHNADRENDNNLRMTIGRGQGHADDRSILVQLWPGPIFPLVNTRRNSSHHWTGTWFICSREMDLSWENESLFLGKWIISLGDMNQLFLGNESFISGK